MAVGVDGTAAPAAAAGRCRRTACRALALCRGVGGQATDTLPWSWRSSPPPQLVADLRGGQLGRGRSLQARFTVAAGWSKP